MLKFEISVKKALKEAESTLRELVTIAEFMDKKEKDFVWLVGTTESLSADQINKHLEDLSVLIDVLNMTESSTIVVETDADLSWFSSDKWKPVNPK